MTDAHYSLAPADIAKILAMLAAVVAVLSAPFILSFHYLANLRWLWSGVLGVICGILSAIAIMIIRNH